MTFEEITARRLRPRCGAHPHRDADGQQEPHNGEVQDLREERRQDGLGSSVAYQFTQGVFVVSGEVATRTI
jgi:hypothetical protein